MLQCRRNEPVIGGPCWTEEVSPASRCEVRSVCAFDYAAALQRGAQVLHGKTASEGGNAPSSGWAARRRTRLGRL